MKNSSMSESCEPKVLIPCSGNWNSTLKKLYIDLFNLIVESRIPGVNERGYGDGNHCPPLLGPNVHTCDLSNPECQKHQRLIYHLLRAVRHNVFEIEVLMLPDCCSESKLNDRIQNKEYILLERWSMKFIHRNQPSIEVPELLRAVRSFLHFSQISAWLSLTKGKSPANIYYWVKPTVDPSSTQFASTPEIHSFPVCKISDSLCGIVKVVYPTRKQYIPIIPCSKHPPLQEVTFRTIMDDSNLTQNIPLNTQIVKQFQKSCDNQQTIIVQHCVTDSEPLSVLKTVTHKVDVSKTARIFKQTNSEIPTTHSLPSISKCTSQENLALNKKSRTSHSLRKEPALNIINKLLLPVDLGLQSSSIQIAHQYLPSQTITKCVDVPTKLSDSELCILSNTQNLLLQTVETSQNASNALYSQPLLNLQSKCQKQLKSIKRKRTEELEMHIIPNKKKHVFNVKDQLLQNYSADLVQTLSPDNSHRKHRKRKLLFSPISLKKSAKLVSNRIRITGDSLSLKAEVSDKSGIFDSDINYETEVSASLSKNIETSVEKELKKQVKCKEIPLHCEILDNIESNTGSIFPLINCCDSTLCATTILDADVHTKYELINDECNSELLLKEAEKISKPFKCRHSSKTHSKYISPQLKQFKLKKRFSKAFIKSKVSSHLKSLDMFSDSELFSFHSPNEINGNVLDFNVSKNGLSVRDTLLESNKSSKDLIGSLTCDKTSKNLKNILFKTALSSKRKRGNNLNCSLITDNKFVENDLEAQFSNVSKIEIKDELKNYSSLSSQPSNLQTPTTYPEHEVIYLEEKIDDTTKMSSFSIPNDKELIKSKSLLTSVMDYPNKRTDILNNIRKLDFCTDLNQKTSPYNDLFPKNTIKFAKGRKLLGNFEESILKGCLLPVRNVNGFHVEIGASGSFCPNHVTLPADVSFYELDNPHSGTTPYMAHVSLNDIEYCLPKKGAVQVTLFNPSETVVKMFVLNYDLSDMPPMCHTFIRQKIYFMPIGSTEECPSSPKWLRFIVHLRFASSKNGKVYLHKEFKIVVLNKSNDDAASEFSQEPRELQSFIHVPMNPKFSSI